MARRRRIPLSSVYMVYASNERLQSGKYRRIYRDFSTGLRLEAPEILGVPDDMEPQNVETGTSAQQPLLEEALLGDKQEAGAGAVAEPQEPDEDQINVEVESEPSESDDERTVSDRWVQAAMSMGTGLFKPLYLISKWRDTFTTRWCLSIAIVLPSGVNENYQLRVIDGGITLQLAVNWPAEITDIYELHKLWLREERQRRGREDHPKISGFESALRCLGSSSDGPAESIANIPLPFPVERSFEEEALRWSKTGASIVYVDLKAVLNRSDGSTSKKRFKEMDDNTVT